MLLILIPIAWLTVLALVVSVCRMAAQGDAAPAPAAKSTQRAISIGDGLVIWKDNPEVKLQDKRRRKAHGRELAAHGMLHHGTR